MTILTTSLPSGGYGYSFPSITVNPMTFIQITEYLENFPKDDPLERYLYEITSLAKVDEKIMDCYLMDIDFLIFYRKLITLGKGPVFKLTGKCPTCGKSLVKSISLENDIHFKQIDRDVMEGSIITFSENRQLETIVPTVREFFKVFERYLKFRTVTDINMIKTISLFKDNDIHGNMIQDLVINAQHGDITKLMALRELYFDRVEDIIFHCPDCEKNQTPEERRGIPVSALSLTVDFFREIYLNCPIDESEIVFKQIR